jgi:hypothetical protein
MSRSIHENRTKKYQNKLLSYDNEELNYVLIRKKNVKHFVRLNRRTEIPLAELPVTSETIIVEKIDEGPGIFYPVDEAEITEVLDLMPGGTLVGMSRVLLELGKTAGLEKVNLKIFKGTDPYFGRPSLEILPGIYSPVMCGQYQPKSGIIKLYAYILGPECEDSSFNSILMKLDMLDTLMHELAHHKDYMERVDSRRWQIFVHYKHESMIKATGKEWTQKIVIPYLMNKWDLNNDFLDKLLSFIGYWK